MQAIKKQAQGGEGRISLSGLFAAAIAVALSNPTAQAADKQSPASVSPLGDTPREDDVRDHDLSPAIRAQIADAESLSCLKVRDGAAEPMESCVQRAPDGSYLVNAQILKQLDFGSSGLATIFIRQDGYAYVRRDGRSLLVPTFDNSPDKFSGGLTRVRIGEKIGYANRTLRIIIPAIYDGAYPFAKGRAWVCIGCVSVSDGEHSFYRGGTAICIDQRGRERPGTECGNGWGADPNQ